MLHIRKSIVVDAKKIRKDVETKQNITDKEQMEVEGGRVYNKKTLRDQYGNYPVWMSHRKMVKHKKGRAKTKKASTKPSERLTRRQKKATKEKKATQD